MFPDATLCYPITATLVVSAKMKPMALSVSHTDSSITLKMQTHVYLYYFDSSKEQIAF